MRKRIYFNRGSGDFRIGTGFKQTVHWRDAMLETDNPVVIMRAERDMARGGVVASIEDMEAAPAAVLETAVATVPNGAGEEDALTGLIQCSKCSESFTVEQYPAHAKAHGRTRGRAR